MLRPFQSNDQEIFSSLVLFSLLLSLFLSLLSKAASYILAIAVLPRSGGAVGGKYDKSRSGAPLPPVHLFKSKQHLVLVLLVLLLLLLLLLLLSSIHFGCMTQL
jgi:hypothetical protein